MGGAFRSFRDESGAWDGPNGRVRAGKCGIFDRDYRDKKFTPACVNFC
jgi:hypothetical protein